MELPPRGTVKDHILGEMESHQRRLKKREVVGIMLTSAYAGKIDEQALTDYIDMFEDHCDHRYYTRHLKLRQKKRTEEAAAAKVSKFG